MDPGETFVIGALIVGAGPSGLATAAAMKMKGLPSTILEREDCIGSLWQKLTYDRLHLHIPKDMCALPGFPFPPSYPRYPSRDQVVTYLESYARHFHLEPLFGRTVVKATFDDSFGVWRITAKTSSSGLALNFVTQWLVVASGENCDPFVPSVPGLDNFQGSILHSSLYKNGVPYEGKKVLVIGSGNSGMEIALDLLQHGARPTISARAELHVLPRDVFGVSTFSVTMFLLKAKFPIWAVDAFLLFHAWLCFGNTSKLGLHRPSKGPMWRKLTSGRTPVLDVGAMHEIETGNIKVVPGVSKFNFGGASFRSNADHYSDFDAVIFATGYKNNVSKWLKGGEDLFNGSGNPNDAYPNGWKGENGLFAAGLTRRGLMGAAHDAERIANYIFSQLFSA